MTEKSSEILPDYEKPPVIEVIAGITFQPIKALTGPYLGVLWEKFKPDYSRIREAVPLLPNIEQFDEAPPQEAFPFGGMIGDVISASRTWFETTDGNGLIQVQRDRFLHNWKKEKDTDEYPHYDYVIGNFRRCLEKFEQFLQENNLGTIQPLQYELTYINHMPQGEGWTTFADIGNVFPDFSWRPRKERFLPDPEAINWQTNFVLPERSGRLHQSIRSAKRRKDGRPVFLLELTARGIDNDKSRSAMWSWFDIAHEWIVQGFTDITGESLHKTIWRRKR